MDSYTDGTKAGPLDDPREIRKMNVDDLHIDSNVQRTTRDRRLDEMGDWNWDKAEVPTVASRADGTYAVIEGQNRVLKLRRDHPGTKISVVIRPSPVTGYAAVEAAVARGIAGGRVQHSAFAKMDLELKAGNPYWQAAVDTLAGHDLILADTGTGGPKAVICVTTIGNLMHSFDGKTESEAEAISQASELLSRTAVVMLTAFDEQPQTGIWDRVLIQAVAGLLNRGADTKRLTRVLSRQSPNAWMTEVKRRRYRTSPVRFLAEVILQDYNHSMRGGKLEW